MIKPDGTRSPTASGTRWYVAAPSAFLEDPGDKGSETVPRVFACLPKEPVRNESKGCDDAYDPVCVVGRVPTDVGANYGRQTSVVEDALNPFDLGP